jgi:hypothetical protein
MKERCSKEEFMNYIYQYSFVQQGRLDEMAKKIESLQSMVETKDITIRSLELTQEDLRKKIDQKKKVLLKMKDQQVGVIN